MVRVGKAGFTLLELLVSMAVFGGLIITLFSIFDFGANAFREATEKQDSQQAITRAYTSLRGELRQSHFRSISTLERSTSVDGEEFRRDGISIGTLKDWSDSNNYDEINGVPKWNRYVLFYGTLGGKLVRSTVDPDQTDFSPVPLRNFTEQFLSEDPTSNPDSQTSYRFMAEDLLSFECELKPATDTVRIECTLMRKRNNEPGRAQFELEVFPQNTWPKGES